MQDFRDATNGATQMFLVRTPVKQKVEIIDGFLMPNQSINPNHSHSDHQHQRNGEQRDQPSTNGADQKHADLPVELASVFEQSTEVKRQFLPLFDRSLVRCLN
jgi:hypothetical protein